MSAPYAGELSELTVCRQDEGVRFMTNGSITVANEMCSVPIGAYNRNSGLFIGVCFVVLAGEEQDENVCMNHLRV